MPISLFHFEMTILEPRVQGRNQENISHGRQNKEDLNMFLFL